MTESELESKVTKYAKSKGFLCYKFSSPSNRGVPDRCIIGKGEVLFMELKASGKVPTKLQEHHLEAIITQGVKSCWADNFEDAKHFIDRIDC